MNSKPVLVKVSTCPKFPMTKISCPKKIHMTKINVQKIPMTKITCPKFSCPKSQPKIPLPKITCPKISHDQKSCYPKKINVPQKVNAPPKFYHKQNFSHVHTQLPNFSIAVREKKKNPALSR